MGTLKICSIDIGYRNFCFVIEEYDKGVFKNIINIDKTKRYNPNGTPTDDFNNILHTLYRNSKTVKCVNTDLVGHSNMKTLEADVFHNLTDLLDKHRDIWDSCTAIVIEKQLDFGKFKNRKAGKLQQHCWSYFAVTYGRFKPIIEFESYHKTNVLGCEKIIKISKKNKITYKSIDKPKRKKWAIQMAEYIMTERNDFKNLSMLSSHKKKDDISDCIIQGIAFVYLAFVDNIIKM